MKTDKKMREEEQEALRQTALKLFRVVHGAGDCGAEHAFDCQNAALAEGWLRLAKRFKKIEEELATYDAQPGVIETVENERDELWLNEIARRWVMLTGKPWDVKDGESQEEGICANIQVLFDELERLRKETELT